jgi:hypothetical protein
MEPGRAPQIRKVHTGQRKVTHFAEGKAAKATLFQSAFTVTPPPPSRRFRLPSRPVSPRRAPSIPASARTDLRRGIRPGGDTALLAQDGNPAGLEKDPGRTGGR